MIRAIKKVFHLLIHDPLQIPILLGDHDVLNWMPDRAFIKMQYYCKMGGKKLNLDQPVTFSEKLQWLKLYDRNPAYTQMVDKYEMRKYITAKLGEEYLIPLIGVYDKFEDIDFAKLPDQFVLKTTHDSGGLVICTDKSQLDIEAARNTINRCLHRKYYHHKREWPYKDVKPRIVCEKYMIDEASHDLMDYKFLCFNGIPKCSSLCWNRNKPTGLYIDFYDMDWIPMPCKIPCPTSGQTFPKPQTYAKMVEFAEKLAKDIPFVRVDFYEVNGQLYVGELTFFPGSGYVEMEPESYNELLGSWIELPAPGR